MSSDRPSLAQRRFGPRCQFLTAVDWLHRRGETSIYRRSPLEFAPYRRIAKTGAKSGNCWQTMLQSKNYTEWSTSGASSVFVLETDHR